MGECQSYEAEIGTSGSHKQPSFSENIDQEDIVAWVNVGMHHIPQAEVSLTASTSAPRDLA